MDFKGRTGTGIRQRSQKDGRTDHGDCGDGFEPREQIPGAESAGAWRIIRRNQR